MGYIYVLMTEKATDEHHNIYKIDVTHKTIEECIAETKNQFQFFMPVSNKTLENHNIKLRVIQIITKQNGIKRHNDDSLEGNLHDIVGTIADLVNKYDKENDEYNKEKIELVSRDDVDNDCYLWKFRDDKEWPYIYRYTYDNEFKFYYGSDHVDNNMKSVYKLLNTGYNMYYKNIRKENEPEEETANRLQEALYKEHQTFITFNDCVKIVSYYHSNKYVIERILEKNKEHLDNYD